MLPLACQPPAHTSMLLEAARCCVMGCDALFSCAVPALCFPLLTRSKTEQKTETEQQDRQTSGCSSCSPNRQSATCTLMGYDALLSCAVPAVLLVVSLAGQPRADTIVLFEHAVQINRVPHAPLWWCDANTIICWALRCLL